MSSLLKQTSEWMFHSRTRAIVIFAIAILLTAYYFCLPRTLFHDPYSTVVTDRNGDLLGARISTDGQWRFPASDSVSDKFASCLILFEDRWFYYHPGVNPVSMLNAAARNIRAGRVVSGGSTITMQAIRLSRNRPRNVGEKMVEMILATRLELRSSKQEILALYASHAPFGGNVVGLQAASWRYFGHPAQDLSWAEAAMLAVLPNAPSLMHLAKNRDGLFAKRNRLLKKLLDNKTINASDYELSIAEPLPLNPHPLPCAAPHLVSLMAMKSEGEYCVSTIDRGIQARVEDIMERHNERFSKAGIRNLAAIVTDVATSQVVAYCGNVHFESNISANQVDIVQAPRSSGSILKPLLYCAMLEDGAILPNALQPDVPVNINGFTPQNFNLKFDGAVPASQAVARSLNVPSVYMLRKYGGPNFYQFLKKAGITTLNRPASHYGLSLILGGAEVTLWDLASVYGSAARVLNGQGNLPMTVLLGYGTDKGDKILREDIESVFRPGSVWQTFDVIKEVNRPEEIDWHDIPSMQTIAWKTGTSYGFRDGWAVGVTPGYVVAVWAGNSSGEGSAGLTGASTAGPVMFDIFNILPVSRWFSVPSDDLTEAVVCRKSGYLAGRFCDQVDTLLVSKAGLGSDPCQYHIQVALTPDERFRVNRSSEDYQQSIRRSWFVLPASMEWYYKQQHPEYRPLPPFVSNDDNGNSMQFIYPQYGSIITIPKQMDGSKGKVTFKVAHSYSDAIVFWHIDQRYIDQTKNFHQITVALSAGEHRIVAVDNRGNTISVTIIVKGEK